MSRGDAAYKLCLTVIEHEMGSDETGTDELTTVARRVFGSRYIGTFGCDQIPTVVDGESFTVNTLPSTSSGEHWLAVYCDKGRLIGYDSFGRDIHHAVLESEPDAEQMVHESNCGQRCLAWLCVVYALGVDDALEV